MRSISPSTGQKSVEAIADRFRQPLMAYALRRLRDRSDAEDLVQEVFASLTRRAELDTIDNIDRYIFQVASNLLRDRARRARVRPAIESEGYADPNERLVDEMSPERHLIGKDDYARFIEALETLPERPRMVFILNRFEEMTGKEIAVSLNLSQRTVEKDISRVLAHLKAWLS